MRSSTSNSNARLPKDAWPKIWLIAIILIILSMVGLEVTVRAKGYPPSVRDDTSLWALIRSTMPPDDPDVVALVGSSRMLCAFNLDVFEETYGTKPVQLALIHSSPIPILEDLAVDSHFRGLAICEMSPELFFSSDADDLNVAKRALDTRNAMDDALFDYWETRFGVFFQSHLVSQSGQLQLEDILPALITGDWPEATHRFRADRGRFFDSSKTQRRLPDVPLPDGPEDGITLSEWEIGTIEKAKGYVESIRGRGGDVVFVYLPCRGDNKVEELLRFPRSIYWDTLLEETGCYGIYSEDYKTIANIRPEVDYSHLDIEQAKEFTRNVALILKSEYDR